MLILNSLIFGFCVIFIYLERREHKLMFLLAKDPRYETMPNEEFRERIEKITDFRKLKIVAVVSAMILLAIRLTIALLWGL